MKLINIKEYHKLLQEESLENAKLHLNKVVKPITKIKDQRTRELLAYHQDLLFSVLFRPYTKYEKIIKKIKSLARKQKVFIKNASKEEKLLFKIFCPENVYVLPSPKRLITAIKTKSYQLCVSSPLQLYLTLKSLFASRNKKRDFMVHKGDFIDKKNFWDFRLAGFMLPLEKKKHYAHLLVRGFNSPKETLKNYKKRAKRGYLGFYVEFIKTFFLNLEDLLRFITYPLSPKKTPLQRIRAHYMPIGKYSLEMQSRIICTLFKLLKLKSIFIGSAAYRAVPEVLAASKANLKTIGMIHGAPIKNFNLWEYFDSFPKGTVPCPYTKYGVWSKPMKEYFETYSRFLSKECLEVSGYMRKYAAQNLADFEKMPEKPKILWVCEPSINPAEIIDYMKLLLKKGYTVALSVRPMVVDTFFEGIKNNHPKVFKKLVVENAGIFDNAPKYDVVIGTHSTAVFDGLLFGKRCLFVNSHKWADTYDLRNTFDKIFVEKKSDLLKKLYSLENIKPEYLHNLRDFYYNPKLDGGKWVADHVLKWSKQK